LAACPAGYNTNTTTKECTSQCLEIQWLKTTNGPECIECPLECSTCEDISGDCLVELNYFGKLSDSQNLIGVEESVFQNFEEFDLHIAEFNFKLKDKDIEYWDHQNFIPDN
jgi:hypothetical protein